MDKKTIQNILSQPFVLTDWQNLLTEVFGVKNLFQTLLVIPLPSNNKADVAYELGSFNTADNRLIGLYLVKLKPEVWLERNKVGLRELLRAVYKYDVDGALIVFEQADKWRLSLVSEIRTLDSEGNPIAQKTEPKRYTYLLGKDEKTKTPTDRLFSVAGKKLNLKEMLDVFSVETLTKDFYKELSNWYFWALQNVEFPNDLQQDKEINNATSVIRLITRLMFVWFLKQKNLIADELFEASELGKMLHYNDKTGSTFYKAILQNLFFATLNTEIGEKRKFVNRQYGIQGFYRYERFFKNKERFLELNQNTPFLNGGLFENLDKNVGEENEIRIDCFSNRINKEEFLKVPDFLFFGEEKQIDLNKIYGTKGKTYTVRGLIKILKTYNFTIEENTPTDIEVALDPELLGKVFENLLASFNPETQTTARKQTGSFYTPREIVDYMVNESLKAYLQEKVGDDWENNLQTISALNDIKILDPACGSGAFPMGILQKMVQILQTLDPDNKHWREVQKQKAIKETEEAYNIGDKEERQKRLLDIDEAFDNNASDYGRKLYLIENCIFGVDIQPIAAQISKLRFFISLICEQKPDKTKPNLGIRPLPNLETKFVAANSLIGLDTKQRNLGMDIIEPLEKELAQVRHKHFSARTPETKRKNRDKDSELRRQIAEKLKEIGFANDAAEKIAQWNPYDQNTSAEWFDAEWMFDVKEGFDIVIGNPPYVSTKGVNNEDKKSFEKEYGFSDDTYTHFFFKGSRLLAKKGGLTYITPKTFWTTQTKRNLRDLLLSKTINFIFDTANPFEAAMVDTCITSIQNSETKNNKLKFLDGSKDLSNPLLYTIDQKIYLNTQNSVIFKPTPENMKIYELYGQRVKELYNKWWDKISTSKNIEKNKAELEAYRKNLKPGDISLLGCLTEGGQGLATANNGKYIAVRKSTKWAKNILESRPKKLAEVIKAQKILIPEMAYFSDTAEYLDGLSEIQIAELFDELKEKYGRDIFGQGYVYRLVEDSEIADVDSLTDDEKRNGIPETKNYYVPYDKGDKDGNRWYLETPFAIAWSQKNVGFLKANSGKKGEGMPVVRNPQFYFKEGFCWTDVNSTYLKARIKKSGVFDVLSMSLFTQTHIPDWYFVCMINSRLISFYVDNFINNTSHFQINDARQLPIIIPSQEKMLYFENLFYSAVEIKQKQFSNQLTMNEIEIRLNQIQEKIDRMVAELYRII